MVLIYLEVLIILPFQVLSFSKSALTLSLLMSGPNSPNLNPLDCEVWGLGLELQAAIEFTNSSRSLKMHFS